MTKKKKKAPTKKKAKKKGGARPGSGPKPTMKEGRPITVWLGEEHLAKLDRLADNRSAAIRGLIDAAK